MTFSMNNITTGSVTPVTSAKSEATGSQAVVQDNNEAVQNDSSRQPAATQAVQVTLEAFMIDGFNKIKQTMASRAAIINNLPTELQEIVNNILKTTQAAQTTLPEGLAALLRSSRTAVEKLLLLASALEEAAGSPGDKQAKDTDKLRSPIEPAGSWRNLSPEVLKSAAKLLRQLAAVPQPGPDKAATGRQDIPATGRPSNGASQSALSQGSATQNSIAQSIPAQSSLPSRSSSQGALSRPSQTLTAGVPQARQDPPALQPLADQLKAALDKPELTKSLPADVKQLVQILMSRQGTTLAAQPRQAATQHAVLRSLATLVKSLQTPPDKLVMLATVLEQAAEPMSPEGRLTTKMEIGSRPELPEYDAALQGKNPAELKTAAVIIRALAETMLKADGIWTQRQESQSVLAFTVPLHFGDSQTAYPAHIHVYHQEQEDKKNPGKTAIETWLRICLETENLGLVETSFRLYDGGTIDIKVRFNDQTAVEGFASNVVEVKEKLGQLPLTLGEFLVK